MSACAMIKRDYTHGCCGSFGNFLCELLELSVEHLTTFPLLLFELNLVLIAVAVLPLAVASFVKLYVGGLTEELDIL